MKVKGEEEPEMLRGRISTDYLFQWEKKKGEDLRNNSIKGQEGCEGLLTQRPLSFPPPME